MKIIVVWFQVHWFFPNGSIDNMPTLLRIIDCCQTSDKQLFEKDVSLVY